tara:strand:- start:482 stop:961 length:480 start_codon:yes stop_codon:yes gene_type:complete
MSNKENYMYGIITNKPLEREPYWDYMARRGAGGDSMKTTSEVYPVREDVPAELWGQPVAKSKVQGPIGAAALSEKAAMQSKHSSMADVVNHPPHYNKGIETTKYIKSWDMNWNQANIVKYVSRYNLKNKNDVNLQIQDLMKAKWYLEDLIKELERKNPY